MERREEEMEERTEGHRKGGWEEGGRGTKPQRSPSPGSGVHRAGVHTEKTWQFRGLVGIP